MDWGDYMELKKQKLIAQYDESVLKSDKKLKSEIFKNVAVFVNGLTNPSADEIKTIMRENGGIFHVYYDSKRTDFIIATNLAEAKIKQIGKLQKVVHPSWITDCLKNEKIIDHKPYLLYANNRNNDYFQQPGKDANDPKFLNEFYKNSRLHHISTLSATFKQLIVELKIKSNGQFPERAKFHKFLECSNISINIDNFSDDSDCVIMHIDIDCFFASVAIIKHPQFRGKPVAVTHARSTNAENNSMSEIASCSYEAREKGVKNGMFLGEALKLCPDLKVFPYEFESYRKIGYKFYYTMSLYTLEIEAVSCDEMFVNITELLKSTGATAEAFATFIRLEIESQIQCTCSAGLGSNKLQARLATKSAKPNGQFYLTSHLADDFLKKVLVEDLPGVGYVLSEKLRALDVVTCGQLQQLSLSQLKNEFGAKVGETLYNQCRGIDNRELNTDQIRKSVSAEVNYGIRFEDTIAVDNFLEKLCHELCRRLNNCKMCGRCVTLKIMIRAKGAPIETAKFLGHGMVDKITKSNTLLDATCDESIIKKEVFSIYKSFKINPRDLRGIGIQMTRLELIKNEQKTTSDNLLKQFLARKPSFETVKPQSSTTAREQYTEEITLSSDEEKIQKTTKSHKKISPIKRRKKQAKDSKVVQKGAMLKFLKKSVPKNSDGKVEIVTLSDDDKGVTVINIDDDNTTSESDTNDKEIRNVFEYLKYNDFKILIKDWLSKENIAPNFIDVILIGYFLNSMVKKRQIEQVQETLNFIARMIRSKNSMEWTDAFNEILEIAQRAMREHYEGELIINI